MVSQETNPGIEEGNSLRGRRLLRRRLRTRSTKPAREGRRTKTPTPARCKRALERRNPGGPRPRHGVTAVREHRALCREKSPEGEPAEVRRTATVRPKRRRLRESTGNVLTRGRRDRPSELESERPNRGSAPRRLASRVETRGCSECVTLVVTYRKIGWARATTGERQEGNGRRKALRLCNG